MPAHEEQQYSPYGIEQLFGLVADVERYPEFLPWCRAARVLERKDGEFLGELMICFGPMCESYTSRVVLKPQAAPDAAAEIYVTMIKGPFEYLNNNWKFTPEGQGTRIDFHLNFKFRSALLEKMMGSLFAKATARMAVAFKRRADALYGPKA